jgi:hypothetical protein
LPAPHLRHAFAGSRSQYYKPERAFGTCFYRDNIGIPARCKHREFAQVQPARYAI